VWIAKLVAWVAVAAVAIAALAAVGFIYLAPARTARRAIESERKRAGLVRKDRTARRAALRLSGWRTRRAADAADVLHKLLPRSQVIIMPGIGHLPMLERPRQSAADYLRFRETAAGG
jgi:pimeloyl-ACP methyl ester carboxylesterase